MKNKIGWLKKLAPRWAILFVVGFASLSSRADETVRFLQQIWQARDGLPSSVVRSVMQSRDGYLWAATSDRLARFDGSRFTVFDVRLSDQSRSFLALCETSDGSIWTSSGNGLARIKDGATAFYTTNDGLASEYVLTACQDRRGTLWAGTSKGLCQFDGHGFTRVTNQNGLGDCAVRTILEDKDSVLWVGTADGLIKIENGKRTRIARPDAAREAVQCLCQTRDGSLWVGSSGGLDRLHDGHWTSYSEGRGALLHRIVRALYEDADGVLWIGTIGGLQRFSGGKFSTVVTAGETASDFGFAVPGFVYSICGDSDNDVWLGTYAGLNQLKKQAFRLYQTADGLSANPTTSVLQSRNGDMWIGTWEGGLTQIHDGQFTVWGADQGLSGNIRALCEDAGGTLWVGSDGDGLYCLKGGKITAHYETNSAPGLADNTVRVICADHQGGLWIGGVNNLTRFKDGAFRPFPDTMHDVKSIIEDSKGRVWIGSARGLTRVADGQTKLYAQAEGVSGTVNTIHEDAAGVLWVGTESGWVLRGSDDHFAPLPARGLTGRILQILDDNAGNLWISSDSGVFRLVKEARTTLLAQKSSATNPVYLSRLEGMQRLQCNGVAQPSGWKSKDGRIWFPTLAGMMSIEPGAVRDNSAPPTVIIEQALADGHPVPRGDSITLPASGAPVEFDFTALSLHSPGPALFKYQLEGYDRRWQDITDHHVRYAALPPGNYRFRVKAVNGDGVWNEKAADFEFIVAPHFYQTSAFFGICGLFGLLGVARSWSWTQEWRARIMRKRDEEVFQLINQWTRSLQQEVAERKEAQRALQESQELTMRQERQAAVGQLAAGLAHEFNNILTIIQGHASLLLDNPALDEESVQSITHITNGVERTAALVKQMLAFSRKQVMQQKIVQIKETTSQISDMLARLLGAHILLTFDIEPGLPTILTDPEMLQQVIVNLAVNARDAMPNGGQVTIRAGEITFSGEDLAGRPDRHEGRFVQISVIDSGPGMDSATVRHLFEPFFTTKEVGKGTGLGLATAYGMVKQNSGWIEVESATGEGTAFNIYFPAHQGASQIAAPTTAAARPRGGGETILVVEDESVLRELVREILESNGYRVLEAATGKEAVRVWNKHAAGIDLLLTDMSMPDGMSGGDLAAKLQKDNPRLPVIFSSGYTQEIIERREQAGPGQTFLSKPYQPSDLAQAVRSALDSAAGGETLASSNIQPSAR